MSYSFTVRAANKAEAVAKVTDEFAGIVRAQSVHLADHEQAIAAAVSFIAILDEDETKDVVVSVNGTVSWSQGEEAEKFTHAAVGISASLSDKKLI